MVRIGACLRHILVATLAAVMLAGFAREARSQELLTGADGPDVQDIDESQFLDCLFDPACPLLEPAETTSGPAETSEGGEVGGGLTSPSAPPVSQTPSL